ncbi:hypothetical protein DPMN_179486 [Dreissena polymorpha]|uniref:Uncharacterized protein n=1 Tax=Dreissena polymorpha TaxID=45954 RepID=A0A9D4EEU3_DREPO|nr:hypothetical protein DPMN_179486 [Dreissena polymorpha]
MSLLETVVQMITLWTTSVRTMKATPWRCIKSSPLNHILCPSSVDVFPNPSHLISASPMISQRYLALQIVRQFMDLTIRIECLYVPMVVPFVTNSIDGLAPEANLSLSPSGLAVDCAVVVIQGPARSGVVFCFSPFKYF